MSTHVSKVANVIIPVADQDRALAVLHRGPGPGEARRRAVRRRQPLDRGRALRRGHADRDLPSRAERDRRAARTPASRSRPTTSTPTTRS